ncbi:MAG: CDP-diacylglycerol--serine O-phosphatidyltransferase [Alphaproteobacteria bacterium RIFCSPLOWO2_01_FULL_45_8]|nr:MAG: CDP-diacylglycerol--serine O-phosphatidyltransferase [Alphaproteobacteria bacterium GWB1_45_5]OFW76301.1 MAG: CDP-diacylglycerol--serine O-phosphatidyltransferase [Alphaproteobacteria bacterium GWA1_45_9]OFW89427.1 MAG: CDP-diacylglycerol--serine O-phosphatidyltransferase [Alphaproteobacteria bacterium RIFCSPHIGHO2_01_FULL_41_14]OFW96401.1 MAG: CDP-diacylglycerol--serine O-phosphatidyltransferase [Alphaproteobacteria bacterium RIFCSPLOWO2_01_FULL_45_8]HCI48675.1 CDP-diacylglycerol--seri
MKKTKKTVLGRRLSHPFSPSLKEFPFHKFIPNLLTLTALSAGLTAIRFALMHKWETAVALVFIAMILDGMDGRVARLLKSTSKFGAELDSLSDFCNFGVVPGILVYLFSLQDLGKFGWPVVLFYTICMVLRLARFNTLLDQPVGNYFTGVNAPFGALLALTPIMISFQFDVLICAKLYGVWLFIVSCLLVSRFPTFSLKKGKIPRPWILPLFIGVGLAVALFLSAPWLMLSIGSFLYLLSIPFSVYCAREEKQKASGALIS